MKHILLIVVATAGLSALAADANAQTLALPAQRTIQGLFGRARGTDGLDLSVLTFEGYDDDQLGETFTSLDPHTQKSGAFHGLETNVTAKRKARGVSFQADEQSSVRYYPTVGDLVGVRHSGMASLNAARGGLRVSATQRIAYAPYFSYSMLPALFDAQPTDVPVAADQVLVKRPAFITESMATLSQKLGRATVSVSGSTQRTAFTDEPENRLRSDSASGRFVYHVSRDIGLVAGYAMQRGQYDIGPSAAQAQSFNNIELGLDYDHALSLTRRTTVGFASGMTSVRDAHGASEYRLIADARLSREIGRTWHATAAYHRGASLVAGFNQPVFADAVQMGLTGALSQRLMFAASAGASEGQLTQTLQPNPVRNYLGSARLQYALTRLLALSGEYDYYYDHFDRSEGVPAGLGQHLVRRSVRIGLTFWLPLYR